MTRDMSIRVSSLLTTKEKTKGVECHEGHPELNQHLNRDLALVLAQIDWRNQLSLLQIRGNYRNNRRIPSNTGRQ